jgi:hypothetical protein
MTSRSDPRRAPARAAGAGPWHCVARLVVALLPAALVCATADRAWSQGDNDHVNVVVRRVSLSFAADGEVGQRSRAVAVSFVAEGGGRALARGVSLAFQNSQEVPAQSGVSLAFRTSPPLFTDDPLVPRATTIKVVHIVELRQQIDVLRARSGLAAFSWSDPTVSARATPARVLHLTELRTALNEAYLAAGWSLPAFSPPTIVAGETAITAAHIAGIRAAIDRIW